MPKKKKDNPFAELARKAHKLLTGKTVAMIAGKGLKKAVQKVKGVKPKSKAKPKTSKSVNIKDTIRTKGITSQLQKSLTEKEIAALRGKK